MLHGRNGEDGTLQGLIDVIAQCEGDGVCEPAFIRYLCDAVGGACLYGFYIQRVAAEKLLDDSWLNEQDCVPALLSPNRGEKNLLLLKDTGVEYFFSCLC